MEEYTFTENKKFLLYNFKVKKMFITFYLIRKCSHIKRADISNIS